LLGFDPRHAAAITESVLAFTGLRTQIDWPVGHYSTGMMARLGFALATFIQPAVLIVDEVLSVGDQSFQDKCQDRIAEFRANGTCIVFCSHNLDQVRNICGRAIWLHRGRVEADGVPSDVLRAYSSNLVSMDPGSHKVTDSPPRVLCQILSASLSDSAGVPTSTFRPGQTMQVDITAFFSADFRGEPGVAVGVVREDGLVVYITATSLEGVTLRKLSDTVFATRLVFTNLNLTSGRYYLNISATDEHSMQAYSVFEKAATFQVHSSSPHGGLVSLEHLWSDAQEFKES